MAEVTYPSGVNNKPSISTVGACPAHRPGGFKIYQEVKVGHLAYIRSDGKVALATGAAADEKAKVRGIIADDVKTGFISGATLMRDVDVAYDTGNLDPGTDLYLSGVTPGCFATTPSVGGTQPIAYVVEAGLIHFHGGHGGGTEVDAFLANVPQAAEANVATADAADLATAIALANANKAKINALLAKLRTAGIIAP